MAAKPAYPKCGERGLRHDFSRSRVEPAKDPGGSPRRVYYCSFCGAERPRRQP